MGVRLISRAVLACLLAVTCLAPLLGTNVPEAAAAPTFHLPWEKGSVWQITCGNNQCRHWDAANRYGFDAVPVANRSTNKVASVAAGRIAFAQWNVPGPIIRYDGNGNIIGHAGNCVVIKHEEGVYSLYAHLAHNSIPENFRHHNAEVPAGAVIGTVGETGAAIGAHLHWSVNRNSRTYSQFGYETCAGDSIPSQYADDDAELREDGRVPRQWRYYESTRAAGVSCPSQPLKVVQPLVISPDNPAPGQAMTASFAVQNVRPSQCGAYTATWIGVGGRGPGGAITDFPLHNNVTIAPGQTWSYKESKSFNPEGDYGFGIYVENLTVANPDGHVTTRNLRIACAAQPAIESGLVATSDHAFAAGQPVTARFTIRNTGCANFAPRLIGVGARGPNGADQNHDMGWLENIVIPPNGTHEVSVSRSFGEPGVYRLFFSYYSQSEQWISDIPTLDPSALGWVEITIVEPAPDLPPTEAVTEEPAPPDVPPPPEPTEEPQPEETIVPVEPVDDDQPPISEAPVVTEPGAEEPDPVVTEPAPVEPIVDDGGSQRGVICATTSWERYSLRVADPNRDGIFTLSEFQSIADNGGEDELSRSEAAGIVAALNERGVDGIRYNQASPCGSGGDAPSDTGPPADSGDNVAPGSDTSTQDPGSTEPGDTQQEPPRSAQVTGTGGDAVNCRSGPGGDTPVIALVPEGTVLDVTGPRVGGWLPVICDGLNGFVSDDYLIIVPDPIGRDEPAVPSQTQPPPAENSGDDLAGQSSEAATETPATTEPTPTSAAPLIVPVEGGTVVEDPTTTDPESPSSNDGQPSQDPPDAENDYLSVEPGSATEQPASDQNTTVDDPAQDGVEATQPADDGDQSDPGVILPVDDTATNPAAEPDNQSDDAGSRGVEDQSDSAPEPLPVVAVEDSEASGGAAEAVSNSPQTVWSVVPSDNAGFVTLRLDLGVVQDVGAISFVTNSLLPTGAEIWLSVDGGTWWSLASINGETSDLAEVTIEAGYQARFVMFVLPVSGDQLVGGIGQVEVLPAENGESENLGNLGEPEPPLETPATDPIPEEGLEPATSDTPPNDDDDLLEPGG